MVNLNYWLEQGMTSVLENYQDCQRAFPRFTACCPVLYLIPLSKRWTVGRLIDFSATGLCMVCDTQVDVGTDISVHIKPGSKKVVPAISAVGKVTRCEETTEQRFVVACKLIKFNR